MRQSDILMASLHEIHSPAYVDDNYISQAPPSALISLKGAHMVTTMD